MYVHFIFFDDQCYRGRYLPIKLRNITYLVSSRPYIEICRVCKIYGRRGGAEPSIYFTNPTYFYVRSGTEVFYFAEDLYLFTSTPQNKKIDSHCKQLVCWRENVMSRHARRHVMTSLTPV